ncbi:hypothetical protein MBBAR_6c00820 [Methanobrevibacter arboriphilus JCM 13429 = DSM 1125]|uniref:Uncharacterized protein n=1 Tax=Methanobrevibacter arboriphilus JCM 13429 = DSM 1125 TaxID=1300164 RepID=A0A1V6N301_METAZ|nr:hypothetical protein [Methanobrevibacter arboriphilus]OQD58972.1 hypothetical protein MBBAR_6c00820 [Methanobrevibacter arboriphilus JCM 13429 = DSM 1125]
MIIITLEDNDMHKLTIDMDSGLSKSITTIDDFEFKGAITNDNSFCFHDILTGLINYGIGRLVGDFIGEYSDIILFLNDNNRDILFGLGIGTDIIGGIALKFLPSIVSGTIGTIGIGIGFGFATIGYKNTWASNDTWQYYSYHGTIWDMKTIYILNKKTNKIDCIEVPYKNNWEYDIDRASYIDSETGRRNLTTAEINKYLK